SATATPMVLVTVASSLSTMLSRWFSRMMVCISSLVTKAMLPPFQLSIVGEAKEIGFTLPVAMSEDDAVLLGCKSRYARAYQWMAADRPDFMPVPGLRFACNRFHFLGLLCAARCGG